MRPRDGDCGRSDVTVPERVRYRRRRDRPLDGRHVSLGIRVSGGRARCSRGGMIRLRLLPRAHPSRAVLFLGPRRAAAPSLGLVVGLMLTYVADLTVKYLVYGPWQDPQANNFPITVPFSDNALFPLFAAWGWDWFEGTRINASVFLTVAAVPLAWLFMERSFLGFQLQVTGLAPGAARYAGFPAKPMVWMALLITGPAAGLPGVSEVAGPIR